MKKTIIIVIILFSLLSCDFRSSDYYLSEATKLEAGDNYSEAIVLLDKAIEKNPENVHALINRGVDKSLLENYSGAIADYSRIIEIDSDNTLAYLNRGKNRARIEDHSGAIGDFDRAIKTKGGEFMWVDKAENQFVDTGFEFDVPMEEIRFERGIALYDIDSLKAAFDDFAFCIQRNYLPAESYYMTGLIYISCGQIDDARNVLTKAKALGDPDAQEMIDKYCTKTTPQ